MADALLSPVVGMAMNTVSAVAIGVSAAKVRKYEISDKMVPLMGVAGAMVFAGQMINFSIPGTGSSGHIGGGVLLAGLLGGVPAFLSIAAVLIIQCLFFADGGLLALGSNIFVLGAIPCLVVYPLVWKPLMKGGASHRRLTVASIVSAVIGLELGAFGVVLLTLFSGITSLPFGTFAALMLPIHLAIGVLEGIVTAAVLCFVFKMRPELIDAAQSGGQLGGVSVKKVVITLAILAVLTGGALSLFVSSNPDGLEWSVERTLENASGGSVSIEGIEDIEGGDGAVHTGAAGVQDNTAFLPDYAFADDPENVAGTSLSGIVGAAITFAAAGAAGLVITKVKKSGRPANNV